MYYVGNLAYDSNYIQHHGIKGQKWGVRRYRNEDGSLTEEGKKRYGVGTRDIGDAFKDLNKQDTKLKAKAATAMAIGLTADIASLGMTLGLGSTIANMRVNVLNDRRQKLMTELNPVKISKIKMDPGTEFVRTSMKQEELGNDRMYVGYGQSTSRR